MASKPKANVTLDRAAYQAMEFLMLQGETKDWIESCVGYQLQNSDLYHELRSGVVLCNLVNELFPGAIKKIHKSAFGAHQLENIGFVLKCLAKMGMKEDELFEPIDLHEKKNMMKVFRTLHSFASMVSGSGRGKKWKARTDANFSKEDIDQWKKDYGDIEMEFSGNLGQTTKKEEKVVTKPDDVFKADPEDFAVDSCNIKTLGITLDELIKAVDKVEGFKENSAQDTADNTVDASMKAAQYAAQVKAIANQNKDKNFKDKLMEAYGKIDDANGAMVDAQNNYQENRDDKKKQAGLMDACENLKKVAREAYDLADRKPAKLANSADFKINGEVTDADIDLSLAELIKSVRKAQDISCKPKETSERTEDASKKAARFASQIKAVGDQSDNKPFQKKLHNHHDRIQDANKAMVDANNKYILDPENKKLQKEFDDACEEVIKAAQNAARDAKRRPPPTLTAANASDFPVNDVTPDDLQKSLKEVIKAANKTEGFLDHTPIETGENADSTSKKAAKLQSQVQFVSKKVRDKVLKKKIDNAAEALEKANQEMIAATNNYGGDSDNKAKQDSLTESCENLKKAAAAAVEIALDGLNVFDARLSEPEEYKITGEVTDNDVDVSLGELVKAVRKVQDLNVEPQETCDRTEDASRKAAKFSAQIKKVGDQVPNKVFKTKMNNHAEAIQGANAAMVESNNRYIKDPANKALQKDLDTKCEDLIKAAQNAARDAKRKPPQPLKMSAAGDFKIDDVTPDDLQKSLKEVIKAANKTEGFADHTPIETGDNAGDTSKKAAKLTAQVQYVAKKVKDKGLKKKIDSAAVDIENANQEMIDATNAYVQDTDNQKKQNELTEALENLKKTAAAAVELALDGLNVTDARVSNPDDFKISGEVTDNDIDVSLGELVKAVREVQDLDCAPQETCDRTELASGKAAKFAAQIKKVGEQVPNKAFKTKMNNHAEAIQNANEAMVESNNKYIKDPTNKALQKDLDAKCEELIKVAQNAARDAKRKPPATLKSAAIGDFDIDNVTAEDLQKSLKEVIKGANKTEGFSDHTPMQTGDNSADTSKKAAKLGAQVKWVAQQVKDKDLKKKIDGAVGKIEEANDDMTGATNAYVVDTDNGKKQAALTEALEELKKVAAAAVEHALDGLESLQVKEIPAAYQDDDNLKNIDPIKDPLTFYTIGNDMAAVRNLIDKGRKVDSKNAQGWTPLYTACYVGNLNMVRFFVQQGADVNVRNLEGWTPLFAAVAQGHKHVVEPLLDEYGAEYNVMSDQGTTPLYHAAESGRYTITKMLIDKGADLELGKKNGWKPLHGAVFNYHAKVTKLLIDSGAKVNVSNSELKDYAPLHIAVSTKKPNMDLLKVLCDAPKIDLDAQNKNGATPLQLAVMWGHEDVTKLLLEKGADPMAKNLKGRNAIEVAVRNGNTRLAEMMAKQAGVAVPQFKEKKTNIGSISAPSEPPPPPDADI